MLALLVYLSPSFVSVLFVSYNVGTYIICDFFSISVCMYMIYYLTIVLFNYSSWAYLSSYLRLDSKFEFVQSSC
jgi:hypothetical protein